MIVFLRWRLDVRSVFSHYMVEGHLYAMDKPSESYNQMTPIEHLQALRHHLIVIGLCVTLSSIFVWFFTPIWFFYLAKSVPIVVSVGPAESLLARLKLCLFGGFICSGLVVLRQVWAFMSPALNSDTRDRGTKLIPLAWVLSLIGICFAHTLIYTTCLNLLSKLQVSSGARWQITVGNLSPDMRKSA